MSKVNLKGKNAIKTMMLAMALGNLVTGTSEAGQYETNHVVDTTGTEPKMAVGEDRFDKELKLNLTLDNSKIKISDDGSLSKPIRFYLYTNYSQLIRSYQITIYEANDKEQLNPIQVITGESSEGWISWDGRLPRGKSWQPNYQYKAVLEVLGLNGKKDILQPIFFTTSITEEKIEEEKITEAHDLPGYGIDRTSHRGIFPSQSFGKVVVQAAQLQNATEITLNGVSVQADQRGRMVKELILEPGEHEILLEWTDGQGKKQSKKESVTIENGKKREFFFVGMADLNISKHRTTGPGTSILAVDDHFNGSTHVENRMMFYLKGDIGEKTRLTAQLDTGEEELADSFKLIGKKDPRRFTRELSLSNQEHYPIYGDNSTVLNDVDTDGKFYLKLERDKTYFLWGNYNSQIKNAELAAFNRNLYGAQFRHESKDVTKYGEEKNYINLFAAIGETRGAHNEFISTGGSLYYLKHQRLTDGSLKLKAELRDKNTNRVISTRELQSGVDYEVDNFQGRIIFNKPLSMTSGSDSIISGSGLISGNEIYIVADYEYYNENLDFDGENTLGLRGTTWLGDHFRIGASYIQQEKGDGGYYKLSGIDGAWRPYRGTYTNFEYAWSKSGLNNIFQSDDGGINFTTKPNVENDKGTAFKINQVINFSEITNSKLPLTFEGYYTKKSKGFANFVDAIDSDHTEYGAELRYDWLPSGEKNTVVKHSFEKEEGRYDERVTSLIHNEQLASDLTGTLEIQDRRRNETTGNTTRETLGAVKIQKEFDQGKHKIYGTIQGTLSHEGDIENNNRVTIGGETQLNSKTRIGLEGFNGNRGNGGGISLGYDINEKASVYTKVVSDVNSGNGREITTTTGGNFKPTSSFELYSEKQYKSLSAERQTSDIYGVRYNPNKNHTFDFSYSTGTVKRNNTGLMSGSNVTDRDVWTLGYGYDDSRFKYVGKVEYRVDKGPNDLKQWVTTNRFKTSQSKDWAWTLQYDYAKTTGNGSSDVVADFTEAAFGFAYRPIKHDKLNLFAKVTYISGLDPEDQFNKSASDFSRADSSDYEQKSLVYSLEGVYEFSPKFEMAFKAAHRKGEIRYRGEDTWFSSGATLYAVRGNYKVNSDWEAYVEYRKLSVDTAKDSKAGWVTALYRKVGPHAKVGLGYNWTDYNDDLTRFNYNSKGFFINIIGKW